MIYVYLDESGDLGFGEGGSRYFTIAFTVMENPVPFRRCVKKVKIRHNIPRDVELKGNTTRLFIKEELLSRFAGLEIEVHSITVKKANVQLKLRRNTNILYNYMVGLSLGERILAEKTDTKVCVNIDRRVISVPALQIEEYLKSKVWLEGKRTDIDLEINHLDSHEAYAIQGIDIICNSIFRKYNWNNYRLFNIVQRKVKSDKRLYFGK